MKSLVLYIDKWYIFGAVCSDGNARPVKLPNNEDRIWLFFHEDTEHDTVSYGNGFKSHYLNRENHYYGDIFSNITDSAVKFTMFKHSQPIKDIFKMGKVFDDLKAAVDNEQDIPTYLCFSKDISPSARFIFRQELEQENFRIEESVARIDHLALEYAVKKNSFSDEGHYLVLNACNENLHYSIYKRSGNLFLRLADGSLSGKGKDLRSRCLIEYIVDSINHTECFFKTTDEYEAEYLRCSQFVEDWILKISTAHPHIPVQITDITLSKDPHKTYSVAVRRKQIDEKTEVVTKNLVDEIVKFVRENDVRHEEIVGIIFLGNSFTNKQFISQFQNHYNLKNNRMICYMDKDLPMLVSAYSFIDCSQFNELESTFNVDAVDELRRIKLAEEEKFANKKAQDEAAELAKITQAKKEEEIKFRQAMDKGYESESNHDYEDMAEFFDIAKKLRPDDKEASAKYEEALCMKAEQSVKLKTFKEKLQQAKKAFDEKDWELAKQKAEEALSSDSESKEAHHIKDEASRQITQQKDFDRYIDRADLFIAQKLYKEATEELEKARLLSIDDATVKLRLDKISRLQIAFKSRIDKLTVQLNKALENGDYSEAKLICKGLSEDDPINQIKWTNKLTEINLLEQKEKDRIGKIQTLKSEIDTAQWQDDWMKVAEKCKELLAISQEKGIKEKLAIAEEKLSIIEEKKAIENTISDIKDLIVRAEFKEAKIKLNLLSKGYLNSSFQKIAEKIGNTDTDKVFGFGGVMGKIDNFLSKVSDSVLPQSKLVNDPEVQIKIKELRALLFAREAEFESKHTTSSNTESIINTSPQGENGRKASKQMPITNKVPNDFFEVDMPKSSTSHPAKNKLKDADLFFENATKSVKKAAEGMIEKITKSSNDFFEDSVAKSKGSKPVNNKRQDADDFFGDAKKAVKKVARDSIKKAAKGFDDMFDDLLKK